MNDASNLWKVTTNRFVNEKEAIMRNGNIYQISNGYMGYRGTLDEFRSEELVGITLAGIFDKVGDAWREPVNAPNGGYTEIYVDGEEVSALKTAIKTHRQTLYLKNAKFERKTTFTVKGKEVTINSERFLSIDKPNLLVIKYSFSCSADTEIIIRTGIDFNIWDLNGPHLTEVNSTVSRDVLVVDAKTHEAGIPLAVAEAIDMNFGAEKHINEKNRILREINLKAEAGKTYSFNKYSAVFKGQDTPDNNVKKAADDLVNEAKNAGYDECLKAHNIKWQKRWELCDVIIDGDKEAQLALRYSIFQLLIVAPVKGSSNSIPARALSGQVYKGAIFWDTEMFMFPFFVHTYPEVAIELLRYRINTLDGARRKAQSEGPGYRGAFYAWESQETGDEACTYFNIGDPITKRNLRTHFRDRQVHISGDVAIAQWEYFKMTGDDSLLLEGGAEVILECARFYYSYAYFKKNKNRYEVLDVVGPDEYHENVHNNAFTNMVVKVTFEVAIATVYYLKSKYPDELKKLIDKIKISDEIDGFREASDLIYLPEPDPETGVIEQFDAYYKLEDVSREELKKRIIHPDEYMGAGQGIAVQTQIIKQADVIMMMNIFKNRFSREIKKANWEYYEPRTEHGSSLSACAYAMVAADIGKTDYAYNYFLKTAKLDIEAKYKVYVGTIFMGGSHPAANGGAWMTAVFGFAGLSADAEKVTINPNMYKKWKSLTFNLIYKGDSYSLTVTGKNVVVRAMKSNRAGRLFSVNGKTIECQPGQELNFKY
ncbi:MAG: glycoside hydrolase family 65 protein [Bacteroidales bacterium]|nr:MAG: glycoside hydrolase family 65 protein [Bacteroidales bacterium]